MAKYTYEVAVMRYDGEGSPAILIDRYLTPEEAIDMLLHIRGNEIGTKVAGKEEVEAEEEKSPEESRVLYSTPGTKKRERKCSLCGGTGHDVRKCSGNKPENFGFNTAYTPAPEEEVEAEEELAGPEDIDEPAPPPEPSVVSVVGMGNDEVNWPEAKKQAYKRLSTIEKNLVRDARNGMSKMEISHTYPNIEMYRINDLIFAYGPMKPEGT